VTSGPMRNRSFLPETSHDLSVLWTWWTCRKRGYAVSAAALGDEQVRTLELAGRHRARRTVKNDKPRGCSAWRTGAPCVGAGLADQPSVLRFLDQSCCDAGWRRIR